MDSSLKSSKLVDSINKMLHLTNSLKIYTNLVKDLNKDIQSPSHKCVLMKLDETVENILLQADQMYLNRPRTLIRTESNRLIDRETSINSSHSSSPSFDSCIDDGENDMKELCSNNFNSNKYAQDKLCSIAYYLITDMVDLDDISVSKAALKKFIFKVSQHYHLNPYHNFAHAISVLQFTYMLLNKITVNDLVHDDYSLFAVLIAALVHDIDHPGHTNTFEIGCSSHLALRYSNNSVLENHHCSTAFYLMQLPDIHLLGSVPIEHFNHVREIIIECILSTDMKYHDALVKKLEQKQTIGFDWTNLEDLIIIYKSLIHLADLSNQLRPFDISLIGSNNLKREFTNQVEREEKLKLNISEYLRITNDESQYKGEYNFSNHVVFPLVNIIVDIFPELDFVKSQLLENILIWKSKFESELSKKK